MNDKTAILNELHSRAQSETLVGNVQMTDEEARLLQSYATDKLKRAIINRSSILGQDNLLVFLSMVTLLRDWKSESDDDEKMFWPYVFECFAIPHEDGKSSANEYAYKVFREVISTIKVRAGAGHKYYTTSLLHAFSPKSAFFALFDQIFKFYEKTLNWQYDKGDEIFLKFAQAMKERFESNVRHDDVYIKALQSSSAVKLLFTMYTNIGAEFVEQAVSLIEKLVDSQYVVRNSYIEQILNEWWQKHSREEQLRSRRTRADSERVVSDVKKLRARYEYDKKSIQLVIPPIRIGVLNGIPIARLVANGEVVSEAKMRWTNGRLRNCDVNQDSYRA